MSALSSGLMLGMVAAVGIAGYSWLVLPEGKRMDRLYAIALNEGIANTIPVGRVAQVKWLGQSRWHRLPQWRGVFGAMLLIGGIEGWLWRRRQAFPGYYRMLWLFGGGVLLLAFAAFVLFVLWLRAIPTVWVLPIFSALVLAISFSLVAGFPAIR